MEFVHQGYQPGETIAAIATPPGEGGIAVIRISGDDAVAVAERIFSGDVSSYATHTAHYGNVLNAAGEAVDDVLLLVMHGPRSYTGEDVVEISCHGGSLITRRVLEVVLAAGARPARPGEFTFRAFINGRLDLAQAEAVQELIFAKNEHALDAAEDQLQGKLSAKIAQFQQELTQIAAILEAWVDFPEEGLEFASIDEVCDKLKTISSAMQQLDNTFHDGRILHDGISLCLVGSPNVGKSSLMNALVDRERAIVSHIPGTTRDIVEDHIRLNGLNVRVVDTAGIRDATEGIEQEGIRRTKQAMSEADLVLFVLDASAGITEEEHALATELPPTKTIAVWNKIDLESNELPAIAIPHTAKISAKEKWGFEDLHSKIDEVVWEEGPPTREEIVITSLRHKEALSSAIRFCDAVIQGLRSGDSPEFVAMEMRDCLKHLGVIIGTNITEDILSAIFSTFCVGK